MTVTPNMHCSFPCISKSLCIEQFTKWVWTKWLLDEVEIGRSWNWTKWQLDEVSLDEVVLDEMGLDEVAVPHLN